MLVKKQEILLIQSNIQNHDLLAMLKFPLMSRLMLIGYVIFILNRLLTAIVDYLINFSVYIPYVLIIYLSP